MSSRPVPASPRPRAGSDPDPGGWLPAFAPGLLAAVVLAALATTVTGALDRAGVGFVIATAFVVTAALVRTLDVDRRLGILIAVGTAICGNSAIAATAPVIDADDDAISFASAVITLFGTLAMLTYPFLGRLVGLTAEQFGFLAGAGVHDSAQAVASGFMHSATAGGVATVVKLTRTGFLVPVVIGLGVVARRRAPGAGEGASRGVLPLFAVGFVVASLVRTVGDAGLGGTAWWGATLRGLEVTAGFLLVTAMAGVGLNTHVAGLRRIGAAPLIVGMAASVLAAAAALGVTLLVT